MASSSSIKKLSVTNITQKSLLLVTVLIFQFLEATAPSRLKPQFSPTMSFSIFEVASATLNTGCTPPSTSTCRLGDWCGLKLLGIKVREMNLVLDTGTTRIGKESRGLLKASSIKCLCMSWVIGFCIWELSGVLLIGIVGQFILQVMRLKDIQMRCRILTRWRSNKILLKLCILEVNK